MRRTGRRVKESGPKERRNLGPTALSRYGENCYIMDMRIFKKTVFLLCVLAVCGPVFGQWWKESGRAARRVTRWEQNKGALLGRARRFETIKGPGGSADAVQRSLWKLNAVDAAFEARGGAGKDLLRHFEPLPIQVDLRARAKESFWRRLLRGDAQKGLWKNEMARRSNRMLTAYRIVREDRLRRMEREEPAMLNAMERLPLWDTKRLVRELVPPSAKYIFIGEYHDVPEIQRQVAAVAVAYRDLYPQKEIIFLSEYLNDYYPSFLFPAADPLFKEPEQEMLEAVFTRRINLAGLEEYNRTDDFVKISSKEINAGVTLEGMRVRNAYWEKVIRAWRAKHPDAVFIIHGGLGHISYAEPLTVSARFPQRESFVLALLPYSFKKEGSPFLIAEPFHVFTEGRFFTPGVIAWRDARFARLAGFDAQIIVRGEEPIIP